jgi:outer membrane protein assembly factor BamB
MMKFLIRCQEGFTAMKKILGAAAMMLVVFVSASAQRVEDYPQWRGPNRDGSAAAFTAPAVWPEKLTLKWKVDVGPGYATPIVVGGRVYTIARREGNEVVMALDAATGKTAWQASYPAPYKMNPATKPHGEGPKSTPLYYQGRLYTLGIGGIVSAFDASDGKLLWQKPAPAVDPLYGTGMSPIGDRDMVIFHVGGHDHGALTAFDAKTGAIKWTWSGDGPAYASPLIATIGGTRQVIAVTQQKVVGVEASSGQLLWERPLVSPHATNSITPIVLGDTVIVTTEEAGVIAFNPVKDNQWTTKTVWETKDVWMKLSNPVLVGDTLYGMSAKNSGQLFALDVKSGKVLWLGKAREASNIAFVTAGDLLLLLNDDGVLTIAKSSKTGFEPLRMYTVASSATWAQPAITGNRIFVKDVSNLALWTLN